MSGDLERGVGALKSFQRRVDTLVKELEGSAGGSTKVAAHRVTRGSFSGSSMPFAEADGFFLQYNRVHKALVSLSKSLGDQIELLSIGVHAADVGYDNVEEDMRYRFHSIQARLDEERRRQEQAQAQREKEQDGKPERNDAKSGTKDLG